MGLFGTMLIRTIAAYIVTFLYIRLLGKKLISDMTYFDYIAGIAMGTFAAHLAYDTKVNFLQLFYASTFWFLITISLAFITLKSRRIRKVIEGSPTLLIQNGKILEENMRKIRFDLDDLLMNLRSKGYYNITDVEFATLEPNGDFTVLAKSQKRPLTPADMHISTSYEGLASELIIDGLVIEGNLEQNHLTRQWLENQLKVQKISDVRQVNLAILQSDGTVYFDKKADNLQNMNNPHD